MCILKRPSFAKGLYFTVNIWKFHIITVLWRSDGEFLMLILSLIFFFKRFYTIFFKFIYFIYLFIFHFWLCWVLGSCEGSLQPRQVGATPHRGAGTALHRGAQASHHRGPSRCGAQAPDAQAQQLWLTGPAAPWHVGSSQTRARTRVPCISRQTLNHCATREAPWVLFLIIKRELDILVVHCLK